jgi:hypothetical protein
MQTLGVIYPHSIKLKAVNMNAKVDMIRVRGESAETIGNPYRG